MTRYEFVPRTWDNKKALTKTSRLLNVSFICLASILLFLLFGLQKIQVTQRCGKAHQHGHDGYKDVRSVPNNLLKHGCSDLT
jgi:hypothetical protein